MVVNPTVIKNGLSVSWKWLIKAAPTIGVILGVGMMGGGAVKTGIETPKMKEKLDELNEDPDLTPNEYLKKKLKILAYHLGLPVFLELCGAGMILGGYKIKWTQAALATTALAAKTEDMEKLEQKVISKYGDKEYGKIREEIAKDDIQKHPVNFSTIINTGHGNTLCYDPIVHDYYLSDLDFIRKMADQLNKEATMTRWGAKKSAISYNDWRDVLDLPECSSVIENGRAKEISKIDIGKDLGWFNKPIELEFTVGRLSDDTVYHIVGFTRKSQPQWNIGIADHNREDITHEGYDYDDDETDLPWR